MSAAGLLGSDTILLFYATLAWTVIVSIPVYASSIRLPKIVTEPLIDTHLILCGVMLIVISI